MSGSFGVVVVGVGVRNPHATPERFAELSACGRHPLISCEKNLLCRKLVGVIGSGRMVG